MKKCILSFLMLSLFGTSQAQTNVVFYTTEGDFMVLIHDDLAPITGDNFLDLVNDEFYDGIIFHRVIDNFIIQGGDPTGTGTGGPGYTIDDEFAPSLSNIKKTISMANSGPDTGGSQFFFNMVDNVYLDHDEAPLTSAHPVFGIVVENFNVVEDIAGVPVDGLNKPTTDVVIDSIRVTDILLTGIEDINKTSVEISVYPNPITSESYLNITSEVETTTEIQVYDAFGKIVAIENVSLVQGHNQIELQTLLKDAQSGGIYHLRVINGEAVRTVRLAIP